MEVLTIKSHIGKYKTLDKPVVLPKTSCDNNENIAWSNINGIQYKNSADLAFANITTMKAWLSHNEELETGNWRAAAMLTSKSLNAINITTRVKNLCLMFENMETVRRMLELNTADKIEKDES